MCKQKEIYFLKLCYLRIKSLVFKIFSGVQFFQLVPKNQTKRKIAKFKPRNKAKTGLFGAVRAPKRCFRKLRYNIPKTGKQKRGNCTAFRRRAESEPAEWCRTGRRENSGFFQTTTKIKACFFLYDLKFFAKNFKPIYFKKERRVF